MKQEIRKNKEIHAFSNLESLSKLKNRVQKTSERLLTAENILDKYNN